MLQGIENAQTRRAYDLICALDAHEITLAEFADALRHLPSEILQITATILALTSLNEPSQQRITAASTLCTRMAGVMRSLN